MRRLGFWQLPIKKKSWVQLNYVTQEACDFTLKVSYGRVVHGNGASARVLEKAGYLFLKEEFGAEDDPYGNGMLVYKMNPGDGDSGPC